VDGFTLEASMTAAAAIADPDRRRPLRSLVLNADGRVLSSWPLSIISPEEAIRGLCKGSLASLEDWPDAVFRSPSTTIPIPKVVILREYVHIDAAPKFCRRSILLRDRFRCQYCGQRFPGEELTFDHVVPRADKGQTTWTNILSACVKCNTEKRDQPANYSGKKGSPLRPLKPPKQPTAMQLLQAGLEFLDNETKEDFSSWLYWGAELQP
jgi:5-methylcytosine-specific restriction endonuclease McrA